MSSPSPVEAIYFGALAKATPEERALYLDEACQGEPDWRRRVERLLEAHPRACAFLEEPGAGLGVTGEYAHEESAEGNDVNALGEAIGTTIGPYKLLQQLGEGGMGSVWVAEQQEPVKRRVALKVIKPGMDSAQVIRRFQAERQALALMDHTNIAKVLDAGTSASGRPYFVMELVKGVAITRYCDELHLSLRERLELFVPVCQAIQHAHQKGIIHRDLKPSNVLVCMQDGKPVPKVIDFGVAKALHQQLTEQSIYTEVGAIIGTLEYMSPEQAELSALDIDTRADVYALGVLLYELLTGTTPLDKMRLRRAAYAEMLRMIREEEPPKPSTRLTESKESLASLAALRRTEPARLSKEVRGELDWIAMKCLEKDRTRRYESASGLAREIERYLADEPVEACPPGAGYRLRKFVRKYKMALGAAAAFAALLLAGAVVSAWQAVRAMSAEAHALAERDDKERALVDEAEQRRQAEAARTRADEQAAIASAVNDFIQSDLLAEAAPDKNARKKKVTVEEVLGRAAARISGKFEKQPLNEAAIRRTVGDAYYKLGDYPRGQAQLERAVEIYRRVLGEEHPDTLVSMNNLALLYQAQGHYTKAEPLYLKTVEADRRALGDESPQTLQAMNNLAELYRATGRYAKAEPLYVKTLEVQRRVLGEEHPDTLGSANTLGALFYTQRQYAKADPFWTKTLETRRRVLGEEHPDTLISMNNLALLYQAQGLLAQARPFFVKVLETKGRVLGEEHSSTLISMHNLAGLYQDLGEDAKAEPLYVKVVEVQRRVLGEEHPNTLQSMNDLAALYWRSRKLGLSIPLFERLLKLQKAKLGPNHPNTLVTMANLGVNYRDAGRLKDAVPLLEETLALRKAKLGPDHPDTLSNISNLATSYAALGRLAEALKLQEETLALRKARLGPDHPDTLLSMNNLANGYGGLGRHLDALKLHEEALALRKARFGADHPSTLISMMGVAASLIQLNRGAEAVPMIDECMKQASGKGVDPRLMPGVMNLRLRHFENIKDAAGCRATAELWEKLKRADTESLYKAACFRAVTAQVIRGADKSSASAQQANSEADRAMTWIQQAIAAGYKNASQMKKDKHLDALRGREDFKKALAKLEAGQQNNEK